MDAGIFVSAIENIGIDTFIGVPDSALKPLCTHLLKSSDSEYITAPNEGGAVGMAIGHYLATGKVACVYMQNSGIGNTVNPITSLIHKEVYDIPMLFVVGWRGKPDTKDEPQHRFMGRISKEMLELMDIETVCISEDTSEGDLKEYIERAKAKLEGNGQFAFLIDKKALENADGIKFKNDYTLVREDAVKEILSTVNKSDVIVSTTGKISREVYEQSDSLFGSHSQCFLTVGGMGHTSMIAYGVARKRRDKRVVCIEGDGAILMHTGALTVIGSSDLGSFLHICLNNQAHESVGGMPTCAVDVDLSEMAKSAGYKYSVKVSSLEELRNVLEECSKKDHPCFIEVQTAIGSRSDLGRPKETPIENKKEFMKYHQ